MLYLIFTIPMIFLILSVFKIVEYMLLKTKLIEKCNNAKDYDAISFSIENYKKLVLLSGEWGAEFEKDPRPVELSIATTTFRKEAYICKNAQIVHDALLLSGEDFSRHLYYHIVDNGRTLKEEDIPKHAHIFLHKNPNAGGAGGFARGMIESLHQEPEATHVLLMDDDILIQPESIYRTFRLLQYAVDEYSEAFISGAMLYMEEKNEQKEDIGYVSPEGYFLPLKQEPFMRLVLPGEAQKFDLDQLKYVLLNGKDFPDQSRMYAAWWYCCMPTAVIRRKGLPMPYFVRGDDMEYGLRCRPKFMTMNGINVWHLGFSGKANVPMDHYQVNRNMLITQYSSDVLDGVAALKKSKDDFRRFIMMFDYDSAELCIRALEHFAEGPDFISVDRGEEIVKENSKMNHNPVPLSELDAAKIGRGAGFIGWQNPLEEAHKSLRIFYRVFNRFTLNGQRCWIGPYKKGTAALPLRDSYVPARCMLRKTLAFIDPVDFTGYILEMDRERYKAVMKRYKRVLKKIKREDAALREAYTKAKQTFITEEFWKEYLKLGERPENV